MKNFSTQKDRILQFIDYKGISKNKFYIETGISNGILDKKSGLSMDTIEKFYSTYPEINPEWLLTGQGPMLKSISVEEISTKPMADALPLVMPTAIGGYGNSAFNFTDRDVKEYYVIPKFKHKQVDFMIEVEGSSMYPKYNSGDVVACCIIKDSKFIQWNKAHVVATREQGIIIKRIKPSDNKDTLLMVSDNQSYDPFEVPKEEIEGLAIVVGVVRLE
jgi:hypothetical protein bfra3_16308